MVHTSQARQQYDSHCETFWVLGSAWFVHCKGEGKSLASSWGQQWNGARHVKRLHYLSEGYQVAAVDPFCLRSVRLLAAPLSLWSK